MKGTPSIPSRKSGLEGQKRPLFLGDIILFDLFFVKYKNGVIGKINIIFLCIHAGEGLSIILWHSLLQLEILGGYTASEETSDALPTP